MKHLKLFENYNTPFIVNILWEHGDADFNQTEKYKFDNELEMKEFLNFIFDLRKFIPRKGNSRGHFEDSHHQKLYKWVKFISDKHDSNFIDYIPLDKRYKKDDYYASVDKIWLKIGGVEKLIVWSKAIHQDIIKIPNINHIDNISIGKVCGHGKETFGSDKKYFYHWDLEKIYTDVPEGSKYPIIENCKLVDCKINDYILKYKGDITELNYELLYEIENGFITSHIEGYDPDFENKFNKAKWDGLPLYLV